MKTTNILPLLFMFLISACYVDVYETGRSSSFYYSSSSISHNSSSSQEIDVKLDSVHCEKQSYKVVRMGSQTWIAQNLNEIPEHGNSWCYGNFDVNCGTSKSPVSSSSRNAAGSSSSSNASGYGIVEYGRLYDWEAAMSVCSTCPGGWELPSKSDYEALSDWDADILRNTSVWHAFFNGLRYEDESRGFAFRDSYGYWWSSTEDGKWAYYFELAKAGVKLDKFSEKKTYGFSVRCIKK